MNPRQVVLVAGLAVAVLMLELVYLGPNGRPTDTPTPTEHRVTTPTEEPVTSTPTPTEAYTHTVGCWNASINNETMYVCYDTPFVSVTD